MAEDTSSDSGSKIPTSWGWYQDAIKWFIAIAAGLLAFGFDRAKDGAIVGLAWWCYLVGAILLGASAAAGLFAYLQLLGAANLLEVGRGTADNEKLDRHRRRLGRAYQTCVGALMIGVLFSTVAWLTALWPGSHGGHSIPVTVEASGRPGQELIVRRAPDTEVLTSAPDGTLQWTPVKSRPGSTPAPDTGSTDGSAPVRGKPLLVTRNFTIFGTGPTLDFEQLGKDVVGATVEAGPKAARELMKGIGEGIDTAKKAVDLASDIVDLVHKIWPEHPGGSLPPTCTQAPAAACPARQQQGVLLDRQVGFDFNSAQLDSATRRDLESVAETLRADSTPVLIEGHTDAVGGSAYNLTLSRERADAVKRFLEQRGVPSGSLHAFGYGKGYLWRPYLPKNSANRRVRVIECTIANVDRCASLQPSDGGEKR